MLGKNLLLNKEVFVNITVAKAFGFLMTVAGLGWIFFSVLYYNQWHTLAIFGVLGFGLWLLFKKK